MILKAENIKKSFLRQRSESNILEVISNFSYEFETSKITVIMGESGRGKTTLLNILSGLLLPNEGKIILDDTDLYALDDNQLSKLRNEKFGIIPQGQTALRSLTSLDNILLPLYIYKVKVTEEIKEYALSLMEEMGIKDLKDIYPSEMSGGELRRVCIARALINHPSFIFADEPTADLDSKNKAIVIERFKKMKESGLGVIIVTHDDSIREIADNVIDL